MHVKGTVTDPGTPCQLLGLIKMFIWKLYSPGPSVVGKSLSFHMREQNFFAFKSGKASWGFFQKSSNDKKVARFKYNIRQNLREHQDGIEMCHCSLCSVDHNGANLVYSFIRKSRLVRTPDSKKR